MNIDSHNINTIRLTRHLEESKHNAGTGIALKKFFLPYLSFSSFTTNCFFPILGEKHRYIFDKSVVAKQMSVVEAFGLLLFRVDKGKEFHSSKLYVFRLTDFEEEDEEPKTRQFCKNHRVDKSKGTMTEN